MSSTHLSSVRQGKSPKTLGRNQLIKTALLVGAAALFVVFAVRTSGVSSMPAQPHHVGRAVHMTANAGTSDTAARPSTTVKPLTCQKLPNVLGKSLTMAIVEFPPNAYTPSHTHPGSVIAFVVKGTVRSQLEGGPAETFTVGQTWFEPPGIVHTFAENPSTTQSASILATFVTDEECGPLTVFK